MLLLLDCYVILLDDQIYIMCYVNKKRKFSTFL